MKKYLIEYQVESDEAEPESMVVEAKDERYVFQSLLTALSKARRRVKKTLGRELFILEVTEVH